MENRQEIVDDETPIFTANIEGRLKAPIMVLVIVRDEKGCSVVSNTGPGSEGSLSLLHEALAYIKTGVKPSRTWEE